MSREHVRRAHVELVADDGPALERQLRWFPGGKRPVIGLRWGLGAEGTGAKLPIRARNVFDLAAITGPAGPALASQLQDRITDGKFGQRPDAGHALLQMVQFLGVAPQAELLAAAQRSALDAAVVASLPMQPVGLRGMIETRMTIRLIEVATAKVLWSSRTLSSREVLAAQRSGGDPAGELVQDVLKQVDSLFVLAPMPALRVEVVERRVASLTAGLSQSQDADSRLRVLVELRYYQAKGLLAAEEAAAAYDQILGPGQGSTLATGDAAARRAVLDQWLGPP